MPFLVSYKSIFSVYFSLNFSINLQFKYNLRTRISLPSLERPMDIRCLFTNVLNENKRGAFARDLISSIMQPQWIPLDSVQDQVPQPIQNVCGRGPFLFHKCVCVRLCVCVCVFLCSRELSTVAQSSVGFIEFHRVAGFAVLLRASLPKVLSLNCVRICC